MLVLSFFNFFVFRFFYQVLRSSFCFLVASKINFKGGIRVHFRGRICAHNNIAHSCITIMDYSSSFSLSRTSSLEDVRDEENVVLTNLRESLRVFKTEFAESSMVLDSPQKSSGDAQVMIRIFTIINFLFLRDYVVYQYNI